MEQDKGGKGGKKIERWRGKGRGRGSRRWLTERKRDIRRKEEWVGLSRTKGEKVEGRRWRGRGRKRKR